MRAAFLFPLLIIGLHANSGFSARLKDTVTFKGVRENILIGYGIIVGLKGTGDSSADVTSQSLGRLFGKLGLELAQDVKVKSKNAAAVIVTASLPPFARTGNRIDVTVSSIGDSASIEGGMLLVTPLRAGDQNVYAVAQGPVSIGSVADGASKNFPTVGRIVQGATIEKDVELNFSDKKSLRLSLNSPDFTTAARLVQVLNTELGGKYAVAKDSGTIDVTVPFNYEGKVVELVAILENMKVNLDTRARVIFNERTGTVVIGQEIQLTPVAIAHGDLSIEVKGGAKGQRDRLVEIKTGSNVSELIKALNTLGAQPKDLTAIFQALRKMGALQAELEII